jgi:hypothetical protein
LYHIKSRKTNREVRGRALLLSQLTGQEEKDPSTITEKKNYLPLPNMPLTVASMKLFKALLIILSAVTSPLSSKSTLQ